MSDETERPAEGAAPIVTAPYEPHPDDPKALLVACPVCLAPIGAWCGGFGDVHEERSALMPPSP